jgi:hypothetical protein
MAQDQADQLRTADTDGAVDIGAEVEKSGMGTSVGDSEEPPATSNADHPDLDPNDQEEWSETEATAASSTSDRSCIFIRRATSFSDFGALNRGGSIEAQVARARGSESFLDDQPDEDGVHRVEQSNGRIKTESGFVMHFVSEDGLHLHGYDIVDTHQAYPVNNDTLETLPNHALGRLREQDHLKITAEYDRDESAFRGVTTGWDRDQTVMDELMNIADEVGGNVIGAAYYLAYRESDDWDQVDRISQIRDIEPRSVRQQINHVEETLSESDS